MSIKRLAKRSFLTSIPALLAFASIYIYRLGQKSMQVMDVIRHAENLLENLAVAKMQAVAKRNGIRWSEQEKVKAAVWAEIHDIPPKLHWFVRRFENGGWIYPYGQHNKRDAVGAVTPPKQQGMHQAAITLRVALWQFMLVHPKENAQFYKKYGFDSRRSTQEYYFRMHQDKIADWLMVRGIAPRSNRRQYAKFLKSERW